MSNYKSASGSSAEDLFIELFADTFGAEKPGISIRSTTSMIYTRMTALQTSFLKAAIEK